MKTETVEELYEYLDSLMKLGFGKAEILFDTEARKFEYHMAKVGDAYLETEPFETPYLSLHEKR